MCCRIANFKKWVKRFENCFFSCAAFTAQVGVSDFRYKSIYLTDYIDAKNYIHVTHHDAHANGGFYQSPFQVSLIFSFDGGGGDGEFNVYFGNREEGVKLLERVLNPKENNPRKYYNLGFAYMIFARYCGDINMEDLGTGNLVWPGKIMGLAPYGEVVDEWLPHFIEFYKSDPDGANDEYVEKINKLGESIGIIFDSNNRLFGQNEYNVAATSQRAFEECFLEVAEPYITKHPDTPICVVGGCALNIILNTKIKNMFNREVFVGPNPNDCGIAVGNLLKH